MALYDSYACTGPIYDFQRAIEDNATVPLYYDNRGEKLEITTDDLNKRVAAELKKHDLSEEDEARPMRRLGSGYAIITNADRLDHIAADLVKHFSDRWQTGKAMLVCIDKITTVRLYNLIYTYWQAEIKAQEQQLRRAIDEQDKQEQQRKINWLCETQYHVVVSHAADEVKKISDWDLDITPHR